MKGKYYSWKCKTCGEIFRVRQLLYNHYKEFPNHRISSANKSELHKCKYCNKEWKTTLPGLHMHEDYCS